MSLKNNIKNRENYFLLLSSIFLMLSFSVFADIPAGTVEIFGRNGTLLTGSRNVHLNLSYSSADGISGCRWANDAELNLVSFSWEPCTTVKAWVLSEGIGNKTVYFQIMDENGDTAEYNASIQLQNIIDFTPPTPPTVYDSNYGYDVDWWNSNTSLSAYWFNATDDIATIYYKYRLYENGTCYANDCNWTNTGTRTYVSISDLTLKEGSNYSFQVMAYTNDLVNSTIAQSNKTIIDMTKPDAPSVYSLTHPTQTNPYDSSIAVFDWLATDPTSSGVSSGIVGYSFMIDRYPGTAPDNKIEDRPWITISSFKRGVHNQTLKQNATGPAYAVFSQLTTNISENDSIKVRFAVSEQNYDYDDAMIIEAYLISVLNGVDISLFNQKANAISDIVNITQDIRYAQTISQSEIYELNLTANTTADDTTKDIYLVISGNTGDDDNSQNLALEVINTTVNIDNSTKSFVCDETDNCVETTTTQDFSFELFKRNTSSSWRAVYDYLPDSVYYFHVKAKDNAGNWGDTTHYRFEVAAGGVDSIVYSPINQEFFSTNSSEKNITVKVAVSANASVYVVAIHPDGSNHTTQSQTFDSVDDFYDVVIELGTNEIYAVTNTSSGAVAKSDSVMVVLARNLQAHTNKTIRVSYAGCAASALPFLCYASEGSHYVGIATENSGSVSEPDVLADTSENTIKLFMTKEFDVDTAAEQLSDNVFMDQIVPNFGYSHKSGDAIIRNILQYDNIFIAGDFFLPPGTYRFYLRKTGVTDQGGKNVSITLYD